MHSSGQGTLPTVGTLGLGEDANRGLGFTSIVAIAASVGIGGFLITLVSNILLICLIISKCKKHKKYDFNSKRRNTSKLDPLRPF